MAKLPEPILLQIGNEQGQDYQMRKKLLIDLENKLKKSVLTFFTNLNMPALINDDDVMLIEDLLRTIDTSNGITLIISSAGGYPLAAERMINLLRSYSGTGNYDVIVPAKAKSAATMICLGAEKIFMGPASELGPVDPQLIFNGNHSSAHNVIKSYEQLFKGAEDTKGNLEPYIVQLNNYDPSFIEHLKEACDLATDIAVRYLKKDGMLSAYTEEEIEEKINIFLAPQETKSHGRPIYIQDVSRCDLNVESIDCDSDIWELIHELHVRTHSYVSSRAIKVIESSARSCSITLPNQ